MVRFWAIIFVMLTATAPAQPMTPSELAGTNLHSIRTDFPPVAQNQILLTFVNSNISTVLVGSDETPGWYYSTNVMPTNGTLTGFNSNSGAITYSPSNNYSGLDFFTFVVHEVDGSLTATGSVDVAVINSPLTNNPVSTNCFSVLASTIQVCIANPIPTTACVSHSPSQPDDGCYVISSSGAGCISVTNLSSGTVCITLSNCCSGVASDLSGVSWSTNITTATNFYFSSSGNTFQFAGTNTTLDAAATYTICIPSGATNVHLSGVVTFYDSKTNSFNSSIPNYTNGVGFNTFVFSHNNVSTWGTNIPVSADWARQSCDVLTNIFLFQAAKNSGPVSVVTFYGSFTNTFQP